MHAYIRAVGMYLPKKIVHNNDLAKYLDTSDEWIFSHTGIRERRIAEDSEAASDLGYRAVLNVLTSLASQEGDEFSVSDIDLILVATSTPDYISFPSTACIIQERLGIENAGAMDITAACTGFIYALETAKNFIISGSAKNVLVIGTEVYSKIINWKDRSTCILFGDGAGAVLVGSSTDKKSYILNSVLGSRGSGAEHLLCFSGGTRNPIRPNEVFTEDLYVKMNGRKVFIFAVQIIIDTIKKLLQLNELCFDDIDYIIPHQANLRIIETVCKRTGWPIEKFFINMDRYANTSAASIPIAMKEMIENNILKRGNKILTIGFGAGLTFGGNYLIW